MSNVPMTRPEEALAIHDMQCGHGSTFVGLEGGRILLSAGAFWVSDDGGITWSDPFFYGKDENGDRVSGLCLVNLAGGAIGLTGRRRRSSNVHDTELTFRRSEDEGKTWSSPVVMNPGLRGLLRANAYQDTMIRTESGRLVQPVAFEIGQGTFHHEGAPFVGGYLNGNFVSTDAHFYDPHFGACYVLYSDDEGETWQPNENGELFINCKPGGPFESVFEPSIVEVTPGNLMMIVRTCLGRLFQAFSEDNGTTWSRPVPTQLAGTHAPGQIRRLPKTGHLMVVWTQHSQRESRQGFMRTRLSTAISRNGGGIWEHFQNVESLHEETHVEPGPIENVRPVGRYHIDGSAAIECDPEYVVPLPEGYGRWSYPSAYVAEDRVLIAYPYTVHDSRTTENVTPPGSSKLKVLPISWLYGGDDPQRESMVLKKIATLPPKP